MSKKNQIKRAMKAVKEDSEKVLREFIVSLPPMVEEVKELRIVKGSTVIAEELAKGRKEEAAKHDPDKEYKRLYTTLKIMNHEENARKAFRTKGIMGLQTYKQKVIDQYHYIKGKYPQLVHGTQEHEATKPKGLLVKMKNLFKK